jgi:hypothetical protein
MRNAWRSVIVMAGLAAAPAGCGPVVDPPSDEGGGTSPNGTTDTGEPATADASATSGSGSTAASLTSEDTADASSSGDVGELLPREAVSSTITCDGADANLYVEVLLEHVYSDCAPPAEVDSDGYLFLYVTPWHGGPSVFEVGPESAVQASVGTESLTGTLELQIWAPFHPTIVTVDLVGPGIELRGTLDLQGCFTDNETPCGS